VPGTGEFVPGAKEAREPIWSVWRAVWRSGLGGLDRRLDRLQCAWRSRSPPPGGVAYPADRFDQMVDDESEKPLNFG